MKSMNKLITGLILGMLAATSGATTKSVEGQLQPSFMQQFEEATTSPEYQYITSKGYGSDQILIATLMQVMKLNVEQAETNKLLSIQINQAKKTNEFLGYMVNGRNRHDHEMR